MINIEVGVLVSIIAIVITVIAQALWIAFKIGSISEKIELLSQKQDKHNGLIERMVVVEQSCKSAHHRIDYIKHKHEFEVEE